MGGTDVSSGLDWLVAHADELRREVAATSAPAAVAPPVLTVPAGAPVAVGAWMSRLATLPFHALAGQCRAVAVASVAIDVCFLRCVVPLRTESPGRDAGGSAPAAILSSDDSSSDTDALSVPGSAVASAGGDKGGDKASEKAAIVDCMEEEVGVCLSVFRSACCPLATR